MGSKPARVVLATLDRVLADSLTRYVESDADFTISSVIQTLDRKQHHRICDGTAIIIFDLDLPIDGAFDAIAWIKAETNHVRVAVLSGRHIDIVIEQVLRLRVDAYLSKTQPIADCLGGLRKVVVGQQSYSDDVTSRLRFDPAAGTFRLNTTGRLSSLTTRQLEVLRHLANGHSTKEVAKEMHLSTKAIESHKYRIMNKLDIHDRVALTRYAIREGLVSP